VQSIRNKTLEGFKSGHIQFLIASDVAARGIDIVHLPYVFNFDVPTTPDDYVHRIGRTGRAGREGTAFTFMTPREKKAMDAVIEITKKELDSYDMSAFEASLREDKKGHKKDEDKENARGKSTARKTSASKTPKAGKNTRH